MKLIPNPEYEEAEYEQRYIWSPAVPPSERFRNGEPPIRWRSSNHVAVMEAWKKDDWETLKRLSVPSHILVEE